MRISILTYGSRGDIQPFVALGRMLLERGHDVTLAGPHGFTEFARQYGVPFMPLAGDPEEISRRINDAGANPVLMVRQMQEYVQSIAGEVALAAFASCERADLIIHSFLFTTGAHSVARQMGIPDISVQLFPMFLPTTEFPNVATPELPVGLPSYLSHWFASQIFWYGGNGGYERLRKQYGRSLPEKLYWPFRGSADKWQTLLLCAWSPVILPRPRDWPTQSVEIPGYWFLKSSDEYQPPLELVNFLKEGDPPVCISFGSMIHRRAGRITKDVVKALRQLGERALILTGWQEWNAEPDEKILFLRDVPHDWLFPKCKVAVHHGGAGTTARAVWAGVPSVAIPFAADQLFWAKRLNALGVAPRPLRVERLSPGWLVEALMEAKTERMMERGKRLGCQVREEDGLGKAIELIEEWAGRRDEIF